MSLGADWPALGPAPQEFTPIPSSYGLGLGARNYHSGVSVRGFCVSPTGLYMVSGYLRHRVEPHLASSSHEAAALGTCPELPEVLKDDSSLPSAFS